MSSKSRIWQFLAETGSRTNVEIANFVRGTKGQLSWGQRLRDIRKELIARGDNLECKEIRPGIYKYTIVRGNEKHTELSTVSQGLAVPGPAMAECVVSG